MGADDLEAQLASLDLQLQQLQQVLDPDRPKGRLPRFRELEVVTVREVRPMVEIGQAEVPLWLGIPPKLVHVGLHWLERYGGTFGPRSSAEATTKRSRRSIDRFLEEDEPPPPERLADRGKVSAWILYLSCPRCFRRCRLLRTVRGQHRWGCPLCCHALHPGAEHGAGHAGPKRESDRHREKATRIRRDYLGMPAADAGDLYFKPAAYWIQKPPGCKITHERWEALIRLAKAHETLWQIHWLEYMQRSLGKLPGVGAALAPTMDSRIEQRNATRWAKSVLRIDRWALRQKSWHRRGQPRDTSNYRQAAAKLGTSATVRGETDGQEETPD